MITTFVFWNIMKQRLRSRVAQLAAAQDADFVILAESVDETEAVEAELTAVTGKAYCAPSRTPSKLQLYTRRPAHTVVAQFDDLVRGVSIRHLRIDKNPGILLVAVHLESRRNWDPTEQALEAVKVADDIVAVERRTFTNCTVIVGDFNMNPFDPGMVGAQAFNAVMERSIARRTSRTVKAKQYRYFYNPMWGFFGDRTPGPPGTFYYSGSRPANTYWHMFDQVLLSAELAGSLKRVEVLSHDGIGTLLTGSGIPNSRHISDHLPLLFQLDV